MKSTPEEKQRRAHLNRVVDGLPAWKIMQVMNETVGIKRAAELIAWAALWRLAGETSGLALRQRLEAEGMTYASAYRAINDYKKVSDAILTLDGYDGPGLFESLRKLIAAVAA